ncbi:uncharacterized protein LOC127868924 [Dreissena polymorpha]|uniref:Secreted protein n=1 Tax=Dreissena polymorpha TaxID=45954 RepID=A0A9D4RLB0_DREPO|nr:uncharacterized protein LOC127868924 [Dreissena polymorpha]KAH3873031.1 hypothetical protein DPMN_036256 [Dreissena polymorpha]
MQMYAALTDGLLVVITLSVVLALDPNYMERARVVVDSDETDADAFEEAFEPSARHCRRIGERAARKQISCVADVHFYENLSNRVHMSPIDPSENNRDLWDLAMKISACSERFGRYYEHACNIKAVYLNDRRRCRWLPSRQERTRCKGRIMDTYHRAR